MKGENVEEDLGSTENHLSWKAKGESGTKKGKSREKEKNHESQQMGAIERNTFCKRDYWQGDLFEPLDALGTTYAEYFM